MQIQTQTHNILKAKQSGAGLIHPALTLTLFTAMEEKGTSMMVGEKYSQSLWTNTVDSIWEILHEDKDGGDD